MTPVVLHVVRPYWSESEYLAAEAWTIDAGEMLLIDQREVELERSVVFDVALADGKKLIRAEGRAVGFQPARESSPGGLRIRFRRFGVQTKAFIDRALFAREEEQRSTHLSASPPATAAGPASREQSAESPRTFAPDPAATARPQDPAAAPLNPSPGFDPWERSGVHRRLSSPVDTPENRAELLARLRARAARLVGGRKSNDAELSANIG